MSANKHKILPLVIVAILSSACSPVIHVKDEKHYYINKANIDNYGELREQNIGFNVKHLRADPVIVERKPNVVGCGLILEIPINGMLERVVADKTNGIVISNDEQDYLATFMPVRVNFYVDGGDVAAAAVIDLRIGVNLFDKHGETILNKYYNSGRVRGELFTRLALSDYGCHASGAIYDEEFSKIAFNALDIVVTEALQDIRLEIMSPIKAQKPTQ